MSSTSLTFSGYVITEDEHCSLREITLLLGMLSTRLVKLRAVEGMTPSERDGLCHLLDVLQDGIDPLVSTVRDRPRQVVAIDPLFADLLCDAVRAAAGGLDASVVDRTLAVLSRCHGFHHFADVLREVCMARRSTIPDGS